MTTEVSVATDLGALLRDSIDSGLSTAARESGHMPIQIEAAHSGVQSIAPRVPTPGEFKLVPLPAPSTTRGVVVETAPASSKAPAPKKSGRIVGMLLGAVALAAVMGGGAAWYVHHHEAKMAAAAAPKAPPAVEAPVVVATPVVNREEPPPPVEKAAPPPPVVEAKAEAPVVEEAPKPAVATKRVHRTTASAPKVVLEAPKPAAPKAEAPKAEAPKPAPKPAAGGAVDAVLQQQLSGAIP